MVRWLVSFLVWLVACPVMAEPYWIVTHEKPFGRWDSICDARLGFEGRVHRCYLRHIEAYEKGPAYAAMILFVVDDAEGLWLELVRPDDALFSGDALAVMGAPDPMLPDWSCTEDRACHMRGSDAETAVTTLREGETLIAAFTDARGIDRRLEWPLNHFAEALADMRQEAAARR